MAERLLLLLNLILIKDKLIRSQGKEASSTGSTTSVSARDLLSSLKLRNVHTIPINLLIVTGLLDHGHLYFVGYLQHSTKSPCASGYKSRVQVHACSRNPSTLVIGPRISGKAAVLKESFKHWFVGAVQRRTWMRIHLKQQMAQKSLRATDTTILVVKGGTESSLATIPEILVEITAKRALTLPSTVNEFDAASLFSFRSPISPYPKSLRHREFWILYCTTPRPELIDKLRRAGADLKRPGTTILRSRYLTV